MTQAAICHFKVSTKLSFLIRSELRRRADLTVLGKEGLEGLLSALNA